MPEGRVDRPEPDPCGPRPGSSWPRPWRPSAGSTRLWTPPAGPRRPNASLAIARLLILRNLRRPEDQRRWEEVDRTLDAIEQGLPGGGGPGRAAVEIAILRAESRASRGRPEEAEAILDRAIAGQPAEVDLRVARANLAGRGDRPRAPLAVLDDAEKQLGDRAELRGPGPILGRDGGRRGRGRAREAGEGRRQNRRGGRRDPPPRAGDRVGRIGNADDSGRLWKRLAELRPDDLDVRLNRSTWPSGPGTGRRRRRPWARSAGSRGRTARSGSTAGPWPDQPVPRQAQGPPAPGEARSELEKVGLVRPSWSRVPLALAEAAQLDGRPDAAIREYLRAIVEMGDRTPAAIRQATRLLEERQRFSEADLVLKKLRDEGTPLDGEMGRMSARSPSATGIMPRH